MAEFKTLDDIKVWLEESERQRDEIVIFAARAALRALPALASLVHRGHLSKHDRIDIVFRVYRGMAAPWVAAKNPTQSAEFLAAARAAATTHAGDAHAAAAYDAAISAADAFAARKATAAYAAPTRAAAAYAARAAAANDDASARADAYAAAACAADAAATRVTAAADTTVGANAMRDVDAMKSGIRSESVAASPLWPSGEPDWAKSSWRQLRKHLIDAQTNENEHWDVWIDWYERRLAGAPFGLPLERAWLELTDEDWNKGPAFANGELKRLIQSYAAPSTELDLTQRPGAFAFSLVDGQIHARAMDGHATSRVLGDQILGEARAKAHDALERAKQSNAATRIVSTLERLSSVLSADTEKLELGVLLMRIRTLEADIAAYDSPDGRKEISVDLLSMLGDLAASLHDLKATYPGIMKLESARLAQHIAASSTGKLLAQMAHVADAVKGSESVHQSAITAFEVARTEIEAVGLLVQDASSEVARAGVIEKQSELAAQHALDQRNFVSAVLKPFAKDAGSALRKGVLSGIEESASAGVKIGLASLVTSLAGYIAGIGMLILSWKPLGDKAKQIEQDVKSGKDMLDI